MKKKWLNKKLIPLHAADPSRAANESWIGKNFPPVYKSRLFITVLTKANHLSQF